MKNSNRKRKSGRDLGLVGEKVAVDYLVEEGYTILETNYRFSRLGEIDIIAADDEYICFIEVKTRGGLLFGTPSEAVNKVKQDRIKSLAKVYISQRNLFNKNIRFDVIEVFIHSKNGNHKQVINVNFIKNAFY